MNQPRRKLMLLSYNWMLQLQLLILYSLCSANYNPVRSLAANIHSLHSCYSGSFSSAQVAQRRPDKMVIESASLAYLQVDRSSQKIVRRSDRDGFLPERSNLFTLLLWATGSDTPVYWPSDIIGLGDPNPSSSCGGSNRGAQRSRRLSSAMTNLSTASRPSSAASSASTVRSSSASLATARSAASTTTSSRAIPADSNSGTNQSPRIATSQFMDLCICVCLCLCRRRVRVGEGCCSGCEFSLAVWSARPGSSRPPSRPHAAERRIHPPVRESMLASIYIPLTHFALRS